MKIVRDEEWCTKAKCMKTSKRGRAVYWSMDCYTPFPHYLKTTGAENCEKYIKTHKAPTWCPEKGNKING